jgi:hypothetical protein
MPSLRSSPLSRRAARATSRPGSISREGPQPLPIRRRATPNFSGSAWGFWPVRRFCLHLTIAEITSDFP